MLWTKDALWAKARSYMGRALDADREGAEFPFLASLALEFLGRSTVAGIHPALLADPQDGNNILYAFGLVPKTDKYSPKSIPASTVFARCMHIAKDFTEEDRTVCMALANQRNEELHSGGLPFDGLPTRSWLAGFYRAAKKLLEAQGRSLDDFLGRAEAAAAARMIEKADKELTSGVLSSLAKCKTAYSALAPEDQAEREQRARARSLLGGSRGRAVDCPACGCRGVMRGHLVKSQPAALEDDSLVIREVYLPTEMDCTACGFRLDTHAKLQAAGLGGQYSIEDEFDPVSYYGGHGDEYEADYGND